MQMQDMAEDVCQQISAANVMGSVTGLTSAHRVEEHKDDEEVDADTEDKVDTVLEEEEVSRHLELLRRSRSLNQLGVRCNSPLLVPQCPEDRETSLALSWPARAAARAVGRSGAS